MFTAGRAVFDVRAPGDADLVLGRDPTCSIVLEDQRASRRHTAVALQSDAWSVRDLGSRNGSFVDGDAKRSGWPLGRPGVLAIGDTICLLLPDVGPLLGRGIEHTDDIVLGPRLEVAWGAIEAAAQAGNPVHLIGETGTGKEVAARHYHASGPRRAGPYVAVNCAAIPVSLAERLLFGAKRGAYSGAETDTEGYLTTAHRGTLFLDELGELPLEVQAKLLRAVDTREVLPLGASRAITVDVALVSASHGELRAAIAANRFRNDLYFRLCQNELVLPPLRERLEDVSWIVQQALARHACRPHASLLELVLRRAWPGNVRELLGALASAATAATRRGDGLVRHEDLPPAAGVGMNVAATGEAELDDTPEDETPATAALPSDDVLTAALANEQGNVARTARALGLSRSQLRRWITKRAIDPKSFATEGRPKDQ